MATPVRLSSLLSLPVPLAQADDGVFIRSLRLAQVFRLTRCTSISALTLVYCHAYQPSAHLGHELTPRPFPHPRSRRGPWFSTQLVLSLTVGVTSFLVFCWIRRYERFKVLYAPRTMLKGAAGFRQRHGPRAACSCLLAGK